MGEVCEKCGQEIQIGMWPFCKGFKEDHIGPIHGFEDPLEPYVDEYIAKEPIEFRTRGERRKYMNDHHLDEHPKVKRRLYFLT